jgi:hypothetical protein
MYSVDAFFKFLLFFSVAVSYNEDIVNVGKVDEQFHAGTV